MSRLLATAVFLALLAPVAGAQEPSDRDVEATTDEAAALLYDVFGLLEPLLPASEAEGETPEGPPEYEEPAPPEDAPQEPEYESEARPTYRNDPFLGPVEGAVPAPLRPVLKEAERAPVAGGLLTDAFREIGLTSADAREPLPRAPAYARGSAASVSSPAPTPFAEAAGAALLLTGAAGAAGAATGLYLLLADKLRRFGFLAALGLYTRLHRADLLDHDVRDRIYAAVRENPGLTIQDLAKVGGVGRTAAAYHLRVLEREGVVGSRRDGRVRRFHLNGAALAPPERLAALGHPTGRALAEAVRTEPGQDQTALAKRLDIGASLAHWHLKRLESAGVVRKERHGRSVRYFPGEPPAA